LSKSAPDQTSRLVKKAVSIIGKSQSYLKRRELKKREVESLGDELLSVCREIVTNVHSNDLSSAAKLLGESRGQLRRFLRMTRSSDTLWNWGYAIQVFQEYLEASALYMIVAGIDREELRLMERFPEQSVLYGFSDLIGELRRLVLRELTKGNVEKARTYTSVMIELHSKLQRVSFPDSIAPGFRRKVDTNRTSVDLTLSGVSEEASRKRLIDSLNSLRSLLDQGKRKKAE